MRNKGNSDNNNADSINNDDNEVMQIKFSDYNKLKHKASL